MPSIRYNILESVLIALTQHGGSQYGKSYSCLRDALCRLRSRGAHRKKISLSVSVQRDPLKYSAYACAAGKSWLASQNKQVLLLIWYTAVLLRLRGPS